MSRVRPFSFNTITFASALLFLLAGAAAPAAVAESLPPQPQTLDEASAQRETASQMRTSADDTFERESAACAKKILVNDCIADAKKRHTAAINQARELDAPARDFEREAKRAEVAAKEVQRTAENAQRERDQQAQATAYRAEQEAKTIEREQRIADKARKVEAGRAKAAQEEAHRQAKLAEREKKLAERAARNREKNSVASPSEAAEH